MWKSGKNYEIVRREIYDNLKQYHVFLQSFEKIMLHYQLFMSDIAPIIDMLY